MISSFHFLQFFHHKEKLLFTNFFFCITVSYSSNRLVIINKAYKSKIILLN